MRATGSIAPIQATARRIAPMSPSTKQPDASPALNSLAMTSGPIPQASPWVSTKGKDDEALLIAAPSSRVVDVDESVGERQIAKLKNLRSTRDNGRVKQTLDTLRQAAQSGDVNMMPAVLDCVRCYTTLGEICDTLRAVYGAYEEPVI